MKDQTFAMIEEELGKIFYEIPFEGILGLAFPSMAAGSNVGSRTRKDISGIDYYM